MYAYESLSDSEITDLLQSGDQVAFTEIYNRFKGVLYVYASKITGDEDAAENLVHDIFKYLWDKSAHKAKQVFTSLPGSPAYYLFPMLCGLQKAPRIARPASIVAKYSGRQ